MRYVIIRDDDTSALTPADCLERLYRPFHDRGLPVCLATIPNVALDARKVDGSPEEFLWGRNRAQAASVPIVENKELVRYLLENPGFSIVQHGFRHDFQEFDSKSPQEVRRRLDLGTECLVQAGFAPPETFVAPHDKLSSASMREVAARFRVLSTGWFELRRLPKSWWPGYAIKKLRAASHWRFKRTFLLSHPGCLLSCYREYDQILDRIKTCLAEQQLTVLVTHWWEYFRGGVPDDRFISVLHETAKYLHSREDVKVVAFKELADGKVPLN